MRVLLIESERHLGSDAESAIIEAGHEVVKCHETGSQPFPCAGITGSCPVEDGVSAAVVVSRGHAPSVDEAGAVCAIRSGLPLIFVGPEPLNPYSEWTVGVLPYRRVRELGTMLAGVFESEDGPLSLLATEALSTTLQNAGAGCRDARALVHRTSSRDMVVTILVSQDCDLAAARRAAGWVGSAVRRAAKVNGTVDVALSVVDEQGARVDLTVPRGLP